MKPNPKKHVIFLCLAFYPSDQSASQLFTDLFQRLTDRARITVLCAFPPETTWAKGAVPRTEFYCGMQIIRCGLNTDGKKTMLHRALWYGSFLLDATRQLLRIRSHDIVLGVTVPPFSAGLLWIVSRIRGFTYYYMFLDMYPEALIASGKLKSHSVLAKIWMRLNRAAYNRAVTLLALGRDMKHLLHANYGIPCEDVLYLPHWAPKELDHLPDTGGGLLKELGLEEKFVVQYSGNMGLLHDIDTLVLAAERLRGVQNIHFLFIGKGIRRNRAEELSRHLELTNVTWLDFVPRERLPETLLSCDAALISLREGMQGVAVPSKLYGILAVGRPSIAQVPAKSEIAYVVQEEACGLVVEPNSATQLANAILELAADRSLASRMGQNAFAAYKKKYSIDHALAAFSSLWQLEQGDTT